MIREIVQLARSTRRWGMSDYDRPSATSQAGINLWGVLNASQILLTLRPDRSLLVAVFVPLCTQAVGLGGIISAFSEALLSARDLLALYHFQVTSISQHGIRKYTRNEHFVPGGQSTGTRLPHSFWEFWFLLTNWTKVTGNTWKKRKETKHIKRQSRTAAFRKG